MTTRYEAAGAPLNMATLAHGARAELGPAASDSSWFGHGSFGAALRALRLPNVRFSMHYLWEEGRHTPPDVRETTGLPDDLPEPVARLTAALRLPRLSGSAWTHVYDVLAQYAATHHFNLTEATRWSRDRLVERGADVSRPAVSFVVRGASYGGAPLYRKPPPSAEEIRQAFVGNVLARAAAAGVELTDAEAASAREWFS